MSRHHDADAPTIATPVTPAARVCAEQMLELAAGTGASGDCLCFADELDEAVVVVALSREWTRVGRGLAAEIHLDDPTVSRRHALIVRGAGAVTLLDDRSLNGVFVNGRRVSSIQLEHGDEIRLGRHRLYFVRLAPGADAALSRGTAMPAAA